MAKKRKKQVRTKRSWIIDIPIGVCVYFIIVGMLIGNVFVIVTWNNGKLIDKSEAISVTATYSSYTLHTSPKGGLSEIEINFSDYEKLYMDGVCFDAGVETALDNLQSGDKVNLLLHPISDYIWDMRSDGEIILLFDDAKNQILSENIAFSGILGTFGYLCAIMGAVSLFLRWKERRKRRKDYL